MTDRPSLIGLDAPAVDLSRLRGLTGEKKPTPTPTFMETARAGYKLAQADRTGDDEQAVIDAYGPIVTELSDRGNLTTRYVTASRGVGRPVNEDAVWADIMAARRADPKAFAGIPASRDQFRSQVLARYKQDLARDADVAERGGTIAGLAGGLVGGFTDWVNVGTMFVGGGGATIARRIASEALANAGVEAIQQPLVAAQRKKTGRTLSGTEAATNVVLGGVAGGVFAGVAIGGKALAARAATPVGELADAMRERIGWARMTDAERAAVRTLEREDEIVASSPFQPGASTERYAAQVNAMVEASTAPAPSRLDQLVPLSPAPRQRPVSVSEAAARTAANPWEQFKTQVRRAESSGDDAARNPRSTATGRYQVIDGTWLRVARALPGSEAMTDAGLLGMRSHPVWQEKVMDALGAEYRGALARTGAPETPGNLYLMHFAGTGGGSKILRAAGDTPIEQILSAEAIRANPFLKGMSADDVIDWAHGKMRSERNGAPVLRRDIFPDDDTGDAAFRDAQREVDAADRDWADWQGNEGPPRAADRFDDDDIPFDLDDPRGRVASEPVADASFAEALPARATVGKNATTDVMLSGVYLKPKGDAGFHIEDTFNDGSFVFSVFRNEAGDAKGVVMHPLGRDDPEYDRVITYVDPAYRRQGVATRLYDQLRDAGYDIDAVSGTTDLTPAGAAFVNARRSRSAAAPAEKEIPEPLVATEEMDRYWSDSAAMGAKIEPLFAVRSAEDGELAWWTPSKHQAERMAREDPGRYSIERIDPPETVTPSARAEMLSAFDDPDGEGAARQIDSLEHDLRMFLMEDEAAGLTVRLDDEGDVISAADLLDELDQDEAAIVAARACMVPPAREAA